MAFMFLSQGKHRTTLPIFIYKIMLISMSRLGLKGPVYLKEKDGSPSVPLSLISGKQGK